MPKNVQYISNCVEHVLRSNWNATCCLSNATLSLISYQKDDYNKFMARVKVVGADGCHRAPVNIYVFVENFENIYALYVNIVPEIKFDEYMGDFSDRYVDQLNHFLRSVNGFGSYLNHPEHGIFYTSQTNIENVYNIKNQMEDILSNLIACGSYISSSSSVGSVVVR